MLILSPFRAFWNAELGGIYVSPEVALCNSIASSTRSLERAVDGILARKGPQRSISFENLLMNNSHAVAQGAWIIDEDNASKPVITIPLKNATRVSRVRLRPLCQASNSRPRSVEVRLKENDNVVETFSLKDMDRSICGWFLGDQMITKGVATSIEVEILEYWDDSMNKTNRAGSLSILHRGRRPGWNRTSLIRQKYSKICVKINITAYYQETRYKSVNQSRIEYRTRNETRLRCPGSNITLRVNQSSMCPNITIGSKTNSNVTTNTSNTTFYNSNPYNETFVVEFNVTVHYQVNKSYIVDVPYNKTVCEGTRKVHVPGTWNVTGEATISRKECLDRCKLPSCYAAYFAPLQLAPMPMDDDEGFRIIDERTGTNPTPDYGYCAQSTIAPADDVRFASLDYQVSQTDEMWTRVHPRLRGIDEVQILGEDSSWTGFGAFATLSTNTGRTYEFGRNPTGTQKTDTILTPIELGRRIIGLEEGKLGRDRPWKTVTSEWSRRGSYEGFRNCTITDLNVGAAGSYSAIDEVVMYDSDLNAIDNVFSKLFLSYSKNKWPGSNSLGNADSCRAADGKKELVALQGESATRNKNFLLFLKTPLT